MALGRHERVLVDPCRCQRGRRDTLRRRGRRGLGRMLRNILEMRGRRLLLLLLPDQGAHEVLELLDTITDADFALALA